MKSHARAWMLVWESMGLLLWLFSLCALHFHQLLKRINNSSSFIELVWLTGDNLGYNSLAPVSDTWQLHNNCGWNFLHFCSFSSSLLPFPSFSSWNYYIESFTKTIFHTDSLASLWLGYNQLVCSGWTTAHPRSFRDLLGINSTENRRKSMNLRYFVSSTT